MRIFSYIFGTFIPKAMAQEDSPFLRYCEALWTYCGDGNGFIVHLSQRVALILFQLIGGAAVIAVVIGGFKLTYSGEAGKDDAKNIIMYGLLGIALAIVATALVGYVCQFTAFVFGENAAELCL